MSVNVVNEYINQYSADVTLLLQQQGSYLRPLCAQGSHMGEGARVVDQIGAIAAQPVTGRFEPLTRTDAPIDNRWVYPSDFQITQQVDNFDKLRIIADPMGMYPRNAANALGRSMDDVIIAAYFGTAQTGKSGSTATAFGTTVTTSGGRNVAVASGAAAATGLNVAKLRLVKRRLASVEVDPSEQIVGVITSIQQDNLLADVQIVSRDFGWSDAPVLKEGRIDRFLGIDFARCERLTTGTDDASSTSRALPFYAKSGMHFGVWNDITNNITQRTDLSSQPWQVYSKGTFGATRLEENKFVRVWAYES